MPYARIKFVFIQKSQKEWIPPLRGWQKLAVCFSGWMLAKPHYYDLMKYYDERLTNITR